MSDIQELIYKVSMDCIEKGKRDEKERIIKLLEEASLEFEQYDFNAVGITNGLIALIKGEK